MTKNTASADVNITSWLNDIRPFELLATGCSVILGTLCSQLKHRRQRKDFFNKIGHRRDSVSHPSSKLKPKMEFALRGIVFFSTLVFIFVYSAFAAAKVLEY